MSIPEKTDHPWTRKHDHPQIAHIPERPGSSTRPRSSQLIELCRDRPSDERLRAAGSHWALSEAAVSDHTFVETHDPRGGHPAMGRTLTNVVPRCLNRDYLQRMVNLGNETKWSLVHIEAGKRIYQAYAELDQLSDVGDPDTLAGFINDHFEDPGLGRTLGVPDPRWRRRPDRRRSPHDGDPRRRLRPSATRGLGARRAPRLRGRQATTGSSRRTRTSRP